MMRETIPRLPARSDASSAIVVAAHLGFTYLPVYLAAASGPSVIVIGCWLWFGFFNNGLINLMHECAHRLTFRRAWANELLGGFFLAPLVLTNFAGYRDRHWEHHRHLGTLRDPKVVYRTNIRGRHFVGLVVRSLLGVEAIRRLTERPADRSGEVGAKHGGASLRLLCVQAVFLASLVWVGFETHSDLRSALASAALAYGFVYAYGLASLTVLAAAFRALAEHQVGSDGAPIIGEAALRNLRCNALTRLLLGAYGFGEHATHHSYPGVPYYQLPELTRDLARENADMMPRAGYIGTIIRLATSTKAPVASTVNG